MHPIKLIIVAIACITGMAATAQQKDTAKGWYIIPMATLLRGDHKTSGALAVTAGRYYGQWYVGAGGGVDFYKIRSIPIVGEVRYEIKGWHTPFVYVQGGYNVAWPRKHQHSQWIYTSDGGPAPFRNGYYAGGGAGIYFSRRPVGWLCTIGYSRKMLTETADDNVWTGDGIAPAAREWRYTLGRWALSVAYRF